MTLGCSVRPLPGWSLDRKKFTGPRLVDRPAREVMLGRVRHEPFHRHPGGLVVRGADDHPGAGRGLHREAGGGHLEPQVERVPEYLGVVAGWATSWAAHLAANSGLAASIRRMKPVQAGSPT